MADRPLFTPTDPLRDAIRLVSGGREPPDFVRGWDVSALTEDQIMYLQGWLADVSGESCCAWGTGIGALEAAEHIVGAAIENGNIWHPTDERWARG